MKESTRYEIIKKEIEVTREFAKLLSQLKGVISKFDGKCFNKNFGKALDDAISGTDFNVSAEHTNALIVLLYTNENLVYEKARGYTTSFKIEHDRCYVCIPTIKAFVTTDTGKYRIQAASINELIDKQIEKLINEANILESELKNVKVMKEEFEKILEEINIFNGRYNERLKDVFDCNYEFRNIGTYRYS